MSNNEYCKCEKQTEKKMMFTFSETIIFCMHCNSPIQNSTFKSQEINLWTAEYESIYRLWLASGDYENWAKSELEDVKSKINTLGLKISKNAGYYYWLHRCDEDKDQKTPTNCPSCGTLLEKYLSKILEQKICRKCKIVLV